MSGDYPPIDVRIPRRTHSVLQNTKAMQHRAFEPLAAAIEGRPPASLDSTDRRHQQRFSEIVRREQAGAGITCTGTGKVNVTAPSSGVYQGLAVWFDPNNRSEQHRHVRLRGNRERHVLRPIGDVDTTELVAGMQLQRVVRRRVREGVRSRYATHCTINYVSAKQLQDPQRGSALRLTA